MISQALTPLDFTRNKSELIPLFYDIMALRHIFINME